MIGIYSNNSINQLIEYLDKVYPKQSYDHTDAYEYILWREGQQHVIHKIKTWIQNETHTSSTSTS